MQIRNHASFKVSACNGHSRRLVSGQTTQRWDYLTDSNFAAGRHTSLSLIAAPSVNFTPTMTLPRSSLRADGEKRIALSISGRWSNIDVCITIARCKPIIHNRILILLASTHVSSPTQQVWFHSTCKLITSIFQFMTCGSPTKAESLVRARYWNLHNIYSLCVIWSANLSGKEIACLLQISIRLHASK